MSRRQRTRRSDRTGGTDRSPFPAPNWLVALRRRASRLTLRAFGWRIRAQVPPDPRYVLIGAPHTTNWDLALALLMAGALGLRLRWVGKSSLFKWPHGFVLRWLGGVPVQRGARLGAVERLANLIRSHERFVLAIAPEGTRSRDPYWKTGFYRIAQAACVPIVLGFCDYPERIVGIGPSLSPSGDLKADFERIAHFYLAKRGKHVDRQHPPMLDPQFLVDEPSDEKPAEESIDTAGETAT